MVGFKFSHYIPPQDSRTPFERLLEIFLELIVHASGDVEETFRWMEILDKEHGLTDENYTLEDFRNDLEKSGYLKGQGSGGGLSAKTEKVIRKRSLDQIFGNLKRGSAGQHRSKGTGTSDEVTSDRRPFQFGDSPSQIDFTASFKHSPI